MTLFTRRAKGFLVCWHMLMRTNIFIQCLIYCFICRREQLRILDMLKITKKSTDSEFKPCRTG